MRSIAKQLDIVFSCLLLLLLLLCAATAVGAAPDTANPPSRLNRVDIGLIFSTPEGKRAFEDLQLAPIIAACTSLLFGCVLCGAGAQCLRYAALACAFFDGAFLTSALLQHFFTGHQDWDGAISWACFFLSGLVCCALVVTAQLVEVFCVGLTAGLILACIATTSLGPSIAPNHPQRLLFILLCVLGPLTGLLVLRFPRRGLMIATSWIGATMMTWGLGYFFGDYPNGTSLTKFRTHDGAYAIPHVWWGYLTATCICTLVGTLVQCYAYRQTKSTRRQRRQVRARPTARPQQEYVSLETPRSVAAPHWPSSLVHVV